MGLDSSMADPNRYSRQWFDVFGNTVEPAKTQREVEFLLRQLPATSFPRVLDICCGYGRHSCALARHRYRVVGIDRDAHALNAAREASMGLHATFVQFDMRDLDDRAGDLTDASAGQRFDAAGCLWQSFGHFDDVTNQNVLHAIARLLRPGGRLILDIYNPEFFASRCGERTISRVGRSVVERKSMHDHRLTVELDYGDQSQCDRFDWRLYSQDELSRIASIEELQLVHCCCEFNERRAPSPDVPRVQYILAR